MEYTHCQICNSELISNGREIGLCTNCGYISCYELIDYPRGFWVNISDEIKMAEDDRCELQKKIEASRGGNKKLEDQLLGLNEQVRAIEQIRAELLAMKQKNQNQLDELERQEQEVAIQFNESKSEIRLNDFLVSHEYVSAKQQITLHWGYHPQRDLLELQYEVRSPNILNYIDFRDVLLILLRERKKAAKVVNAEAGEYFINLKKYLKNGRSGKNFGCQLQPVLKEFGLRPGKYKIGLCFVHNTHSPSISRLENGAIPNWNSTYFPIIVLK